MPFGFQETERTLENMQDADLKCLLDEVCSYTGDMQGKSPLVQVLLIQFSLYELMHAGWLHELLLNDFQAFVLRETDKDVFNI